MASIKKINTRKYKITVSNGYRPDGRKISRAKTITVPDCIHSRSIQQYVAHEAEEFERIIKTGYQKKTGELFLHGEGGPLTHYSKSIGNGNWCGGETIIPESQFAENFFDVKEWVTKHCDVDTYVKLFGAVSE